MPALALRFTVPGNARTQGSMRRGNRGQVIHVPGVMEHRHKVSLAAQRMHSGGPMAGPVAVRLEVVLARPEAHYGTGRNAGRLKPSAPEFPAVTPDVDKVARLVLDALTDAGVWRDDKQVAVLRVEKRYQVDPGDIARTQVEVWALEPLGASSSPIDTATG